MTIGSLIPTLASRTEEVRRYKIPVYGSRGVIEPIVANFQSTGRPLIGQMPKSDTQRTTVTDLAVSGPGQQRVLASEWEMDLPHDYLSFCSIYSQYLFVGRVSYVVWDEGSIRNQIESLRSGWDVPSSAPHRLFPFASPAGELACFAFRWSSTTSQMDVVYCWDYGDVGEEHLLGTEGETFVSDANFTSWLQRMIQSDGAPAFPGGKVPTSSGMMEVGQDQHWIRL